MGDLIEFPTPPPRFIAGKSKIPAGFWDLVREWQDHKDPRIRTLILGVMVLMDTLDTVETTGILAAVDYNVHNDPEHPLVQIVEYVQSIIHEPKDPV